MKILLPNQNFSEDMFFDVENEVSNYEIKKAFSPDLSEYAQVEAGSLTAFHFNWVNSGTQALLLSTRSYTDTPVLETAGTIGFGSPVSMVVSDTYGSGDLILREYSTTGLLYYQLNFAAVSTKDIYNITYGRTYNLPDGRLEDNSLSYKYHKSKITIGLSGVINHSGVQTNIRRMSKLRFEFLDLAAKDMLVAIFLFSKGALPVWFLEDTSDNSTWMQVIMRKCNIKEPQAGYFSVDIDMEEL